MASTRRRLLRAVYPMSTEPDARLAALARLREPFPASAIGKLPRAGIHLDYVGHAAVTDRLLSVDPEWSWEPFAVDSDGLPVVKKGVSGEWELWIRLTVCGVTRIGVGSVSTGFDAEKQLIGDALRNAAMRFGVALDLWSKAELESAADTTPIRGPEPTEAQKARASFAQRVNDAPKEVRRDFLAWNKEQKLPTNPKDLTDEQLARVVEWMDFAESAWEQDHPPADATAEQRTLTDE
jgi:hypothetical protein